MSDSQQIYHMFRTLAFPAFLALIIALLAGCSDPEKKAMAQAAEAQGQFEAGQIAAAQKTIEKAVETRDDIVEIQLLRGRIEAAAHSSSGAFAAYSDALSLDSSNGEALLGVAHFGMESGHRQESELAADRVLSLDPTQPDALVIKGIYNIVHSHADAALANAQAILEKAPANEEGIILKARALSLLDRSDEALQLMETTRKTSGGSANITRTLLELYRWKNDGKAMIGQFDQLRRLMPTDKSIVLDEANTLYKLGETARARAFLRSLILSPKIGDGIARLVTDLWTEYDPEPLNPADLSEMAARAGAAAKKAAARFYLGRNDAVRALQALGGDTSDPDIFALKAQAAIALGNPQRGLSMADQILQKDKTSCDGLVARGQATLAFRRYTDAIIASQVANANCPQTAIAYMILAQANERVRNNAAAELAFRDGLNHNVQNSLLARTYAAWLERRGNGTRAVATARRLTNEAPALISGWQLYRELCQRNPDAGCLAYAEFGLAYAKQRFAVDRRPDDPEPPGLFSRLAQKSDNDNFDAAAAARNRRIPSTASAIETQ